MRKILLRLLFLAFSLTGFTQKLDFSKIEDASRPADYEFFTAPDSLGIRHPLKSPTTNNRTNAIGGKELPYPIIFIHGLNSNNHIWLPLSLYLENRGLKFGGRLDFCLNFDGNNYSSKWQNDVRRFTTNLVKGNYYHLNFDIGNDGSVMPSSSSDVLSNQSAVYKQGIAISYAISKVLEITGKDKVILMGHSMGGLAARQYLQNEDFWQLDHKHHVAKLVTTGTPHGGSNSFGPKIITGVNENSEAVRDLRTSYTYGKKGYSNQGTFLRGNYEDYDIMDDRLIYNFYNVDVNCDGNEGGYVTGLNEKSIPTDLDYTSIYGNCDGCVIGSGDGIVSEYSANLQNFYSSLDVNVFEFSIKGLIEIHTDLPELIAMNLQGLDEPNKSTLAFELESEIPYLGFSTIQVNPNLQDIDYYKFTLKETAQVKLEINTQYVPNLTIQFSDAFTNSVAVIDTIIEHSGESFEFEKTLPAGTYHIGLQSSPYPNVTKVYEYLIEITTTPIITNIDENEASFISLIAYPNPVENQLTIKFNQPIETGEFEIFNMLGEKIFNTTIENTTQLFVETLAFPKGIYVIKFHNNETYIHETFMRK